MIIKPFKDNISEINKNHGINKGIIDEFDSNHECKISFIELYIKMTKMITS